MTVKKGAPDVFAELAPSGQRVEIHFRGYNPDYVAAVKEVPGSRFTSKDKGGPFWTCPLNLDIMRVMRRQFPDLVTGPALLKWGQEAVGRERNLHRLAATDDVPIKDLAIKDKLPKLAEWFRPYQRADVKFLGSTSALNLNDPGLGKTTETIASVYESGLENGCHLVVAPKTSLETVWRWEIERWTDELENPPEVITYHGDMTKGERDRAIDEFWACVDEDYPVWFVTTPPTVRSGLEPAVDEWNTFIIDEFHRHGLTNVSGAVDKGTEFGKAVRQIKAKRRYALSGTPMGGKPIKLWGALHFLYPDQFTSKWAWAGMWLEINSNGFGKDIGGVKRGMEADFYKSLAPYAVRRLKAEVLPQLPPKQYVDVWCEMTSKQAKQYAAMAANAEIEIEEEGVTAMGVLAKYARLKQFADAYCDEARPYEDRCPKCKGDEEFKRGCTKCGGSGVVQKYHLIPSSDSGKIAPLMDRLAEIGIEPGDMEGESQTVIASQFKSVVNMVHEYLVSKGIPAAKITGDVNEQDRSTIQKAFQQGGDNSPRVIVMTTTAGGVSINLDNADTMHILDETWVPDDQTQLEDRIHRASRMHQVTVYYYRSKGTVEEQIWMANIDKSNVNREILDLRRHGFRADMQKKMGI